MLGVSLACAGGAVAEPGAALAPSGGDDTPGWNAACSRIALGSDGEIVLGPGRFVAASPWVCDGRGVRVAGEGEGVTRIAITHTGTGLHIAPSSLAQPVTVQGLTIEGAAACGSAIGLAVEYPHSTSFTGRTLAVRDVQFLSSFEPSVGCHGRSILTAMRLDGVWQATVERVNHNAPHALPPVPGTISLQFSDSYNLHVTDFVSTETDTAFQMAGYSEGVFFTRPSVVASRVGFQTVSGGRRVGGYSALSFTVSDGECDVWVRCVDWHNLAFGAVHDMRMAIRQDVPGTVIVLLDDTTGVQVHDNNAGGLGNSVATGYAVQRGAFGHGDLNLIAGNLWPEPGGLPCVGPWDERQRGARQRAAAAGGRSGDEGRRFEQPCAAPPLTLPQQRAGWLRRRQCRAGRASGWMRRLWHARCRRVS